MNVRFYELSCLSPAVVSAGEPTAGWLFEMVEQESEWLRVQVSEMVVRYLGLPLVELAECGGFPEVVVEKELAAETFGVVVKRLRDKVMSWGSGHRVSCFRVQFPVRVEMLSVQHPGRWVMVSGLSWVPVLTVGDEMMPVVLRLWDALSAAMLRNRVTRLKVSEDVYNLVVLMPSVGGSQWVCQFVENVIVAVVAELQALGGVNAQASTVVRL